MELGGSISRNGPCLDTVRALHQTVVALRTALEQSRREILDLKDKAWPLQSVENALKALSIENHVLRQKLVENDRVLIKKKTNEKRVRIVTDEISKKSDISISTENLSPRKISCSLENVTLLGSPRKHSPAKSLSISKTLSFSNIPGKMDDAEESKEDQSRTNSEQGAGSTENSQIDLDQEVDDIELIFTTDETKDSDFKEQLVSIDSGECSKGTTKLLECPPPDSDVSDRELEDDVFNDLESSSRNASFDLKREDSRLRNSRSDNSINEEGKSFKSYYSYQDSSFENKSLEKDESFDRFEERIRIIETDISKVGIQDVEYGSGRRNTCPNPLQYRPILHRLVSRCTG